ncbi:phosphotransferase family protein [Streptomyces marispadix]|uniref:Aminoglycoside phosphotransferase family protein n=1 Tax=Streptomyces marispadix TaxID=2922868 RepID=A0ABS9SSH8_9ACTN|nr:phosphotransferase [Streptomyces marispadix]MCH6159227.1 aminoglycoside phosphotransferase family protein [Streptomyces marispadix]
MRTTLTLTDRLCALAREASPPAPDSGGHGPEADPVVLADRPDGTVVGLGGVVAKAHPPVAQGDLGERADSGGSHDPGDVADLADVDELTVRLRIAAHPLLAGILLPPLTPGGTAADEPYMRPPHLYGGRPATLWPRGRPVDPDAPESAPWEAAGTLLARLHSVSTEALGAELPRTVPQMRGPQKAARALKRMRAALARRDAPAAPPAALTAAATAAEAAWAKLPAWCRNEHSTDRPSPVSALCHGDFHLGQLVRHPADGGAWQLIDVDDLGLGDPAWDLARPAAWFATGLLPAESWQRFLHAYESAADATTPGARSLSGGPGTWPPSLDAAARALTVQTTALAVAKAHGARRPLDEAETACAEACHRIAGLPAPGQRDETGLSLDPQ